MRRQFYPIPLRALYLPPFLLPFLYTRNWPFAISPSCPKPTTPHFPHSPPSLVPTPSTSWPAHSVPISPLSLLFYKHQSRSSEATLAHLRLQSTHKAVASVLCHLQNPSQITTTRPLAIPPMCLPSHYAHTPFPLFLPTRAVRYQAPPPPVLSLFRPQLPHLFPTCTHAHAGCNSTACGTLAYTFSDNLCPASRLVFHCGRLDEWSQITTSS